ncbi:MAG: alpha/beta fold hydrolase [Gammaproteobacteria bacterium]|nr:alpha/beta fold hydrolase [Gammaproteobacteria bacterium]
MRDFDPPCGLASPHVQTILARIPAKTADAAALRLETVALECRDDARLEAKVSTAPAGTPLVIIIHGWLGDSGSWYVRRTAGALNANGFRVACLMLRDHGGTAAHNREMFNSARLGEVLDACNALVEQCNPTAAGIMGFSLGGNFVLRLASRAGLDHRLAACLAISPVVDPAATVRAIDTGWLVYRKWFVDKWRLALEEKRAAFPDEYRDLAGAMRLSTVGGITDYLVGRYLPYRDAADYYSRYDLRGDGLANVRIATRIIAAEDDMVIPGASYAEVTPNDHVDLRMLRHGGHCGFLEDWRLTCYLDGASIGFFRARLAGGC